MDDTGSTVIVRNAGAHDAAGLAALVEELGYPATTAEIAARLERMQRARESILVAERAGGLIGFVAVHVTPVLHRPTPVGRMTALVVAGSARGGGVGRALVAAAERLAAEAGCALMEVTSNAKREGAHAFYRRLGYEMTSHRFYRALADRSTSVRAQRQQ